MQKFTFRLWAALVALGFMVGSAKAQWRPVGTYDTHGFNGTIKCFTKDKSGNIYAAGDFTNSNGSYYVAKWDGSSWTELGGTNNSTFNNDINTLATDAAGNIYAAGDFTLPVPNYSTHYVAKYGSTPTPVILGSFTAKATDAHTITALWETATETNTSHFNLQRSSNGKDGFADIATLQAAGNSALSKRYSYTDRAPLEGISYYRLQIVDRDGSSSFSKVVQVQLPMVNGRLLVSPNPAKEVVHITVQGSKAEKAVLQIVDLEGKVVRAQTVGLIVGSNQFIVPIGSLSMGSYVVSLVADGRQYQQRIIKE